MEKNELIKQLCKLPLKPVINLIPYEETYCKDGRVKGWWIYNFSTGEVMEERNLWNNSNYHRIYIYDAFSRAEEVFRSITMKYIEEFDVLAIYELSFDTTPYEIGEKREFIAENVVYLTKDRYFIYNHNGEWKCDNNRRTLSTELPFSLRLSCLDEKYCVGEITKLYGLYKKDMWYMVIDSVSDLIDFIFFDVKSTEEKVTKKIKALFEKTIKHELPPCTHIPKEHYGSYIRIAQLHYVNDEISVIRWFKHVEGVNYEYMRFYITDDGNFLCDLGNDGKFHILTKNINKDEMKCYDFLMDKEELKNSKFKYFFDMIEDYSKSERAINLYEIYKFDLIEKLSKTGMPNLVKNSLRRYHESRILPYTTIGKACSIKINPKETDIFKGLGLNKHQYKLAVDYLNSQNSRYSVDSFVFENLRKILKGREDAPLNDIDNKTFEKFFNVLKDIETGYYSSYVTRFVDEAYNFYSIDAIYSTLEVCSILVTARHWSALNSITDYVRMVKRMDDAKSFPLKFKDTKSPTLLVEDIKEKHDAAVAVYNYVSEKANAAAFKKQAEKCKDWEFTANGLSVVAPTHPGDLAKEGLELRHCVKSYIDKVINGSTNIVFIRKNDDLEKPFFTVEVSNSGTIEQVHGFSNRNANTEPGLENFVKEWAKEKKLKITGYNKIR